MSVAKIQNEQLFDLKVRIEGLEKEKEVIEGKISCLRQKVAETSCPCDIGTVYKNKRNGRLARVIKVVYSQWRDYELVGRNICKNGSLGAVVTIDDSSWVPVEKRQDFEPRLDGDSISLDFFPSLVPKKSKRSQNY